MGTTIEERIRSKAYLLWEEDGSMEGCADEYWRRAKILVEAELANEASEAKYDGRPDSDELNDPHAG